MTNKNLPLQLVDHLKTKGDSLGGVMPGEIFVKNFQFTIPVQAGSANAWKKAIKQSYPNVIIGSQKTAANLNMKVKTWNNYNFTVRLSFRGPRAEEPGM